MSEEPPVTITQAEVSIRRAPKFARFMIVGGALGAVVTLALTMSQKANPDVGYFALFGYFLLYGLPAGVALGALVALLADRRSRKRAQVVPAEHTVVESALVEGELED